MFEGKTRKQTVMVIIIFACIWIPITHYWSNSISLGDRSLIGGSILMLFYGIIGYGTLDVIDDIVGYVVNNYD